MAVDYQDRILLTGYIYNAYPNYYDIGLVRLDTSGNLDTSFGGGDGKVTTDFGSYEFGQSVAVGLDGKIIVADEGGGRDTCATTPTGPWMMVRW